MACIGVLFRLLCASMMMIALFGHGSESAPVWNSDADSNRTPIQSIRMNSSLIYRWLIRLMSRKDLYSWINFNFHPLLSKTTLATELTSPTATLETAGLQIQRDTDDSGSVPFVGPSSTSGSGTDAPTLIVVRDVEDTTTSLPSTATVGKGIPIVILGDKNVDRIGDNSQTTPTDDSSTPTMIRDSFDNMPVDGDTVGPTDTGDNSVPVIISPGNGGISDSNTDATPTDPDTSLTIVRDKEGESDTQSNNDVSSSSSSPSTSQSSPSTSQSSSSSSGSTSSSGLVVLDPTDLLNQGFNFG
ncbi:dentin sialophosphoprotein-like [Argopecten irradians]|uniref:dentin sialophosphoprotein-like n=1 Tax=Argopecten irradians TaxID=31199 RepID=UPI00371339DD